MARSKFRMSVTPRVVVWTFVYTLILGLLASLWSITRAVRAPLTRVLQDERHARASSVAYNREFRR